MNEDSVKMVNRKLHAILNSNNLEPNVIDERVRRVLIQLSEKHALEALHEFDVALRREKIQNPAGYLLGVLRRLLMVDSGSHHSVRPQKIEDPMGENISYRVIARLQRLTDEGFCEPDEVDVRCRDMFKQLTESTALAAIDELQQNDRAKINNFSAFLMSLLKRYRSRQDSHSHSQHVNHPPLNQPAVNYSSQNYSPMNQSPDTNDIPVELDISGFPIPPSVLPLELMYGYGEDEYCPEMPRVLEGLDLSPLLQERLEILIRKRLCTVHDLDGRIINDLMELPEAAALSVLREFSICEPSTVRNAAAYIVGIIKRVNKAIGTGHLAGGVSGAGHGPSAHYDNKSRMMSRGGDTRGGSTGGVGGGGPLGGSGGGGYRKRGRENSEYSEYAQRAYRDDSRGTVRGGPGGMHHGLNTGGGGGLYDYIDATANEMMDPRELVEIEIERHVRAGVIQNSDIDPHVRDFLAAQPPRVAVKAIMDFCAKDMNRLNNKGAYLKGIVRKIFEKEEFIASGGGGGGGR